MENIINKKKRSIGLGILIILITIGIGFQSENILFAATTAKISLTQYSETIPSTSTQDLVNKGKVLYKITVKAILTDSSGNPLIGKKIKFNNPNTSNVNLISSSSNTSNTGTAFAYYEIRGTTSFTCKASVNDTSYSASKSFTVQPDEESYYENTFFITCYNTSSEADFSGSKISVKGISGYKFKKDFIAAVKLNGSGYSDDNGIYIRYVTGSNDTYEIGNPITCTGTSPKAGRTIAVDNYYIPRYNNNGSYLRGCVNIADIGNRKAEDSGNAIKKYHIDVYVGVGKSNVNKFKYSKTYKKVKYIGNNKDLW